MTWVGICRAERLLVCTWPFSLRILLPRLSPRPYIELPKVIAWCVAELAPRFTVPIALALFPLSANIARASGASFALGSMQQTQLFSLSPRVMALWYGADATYYDLVHGEGWDHD
jgi:hypothetical protein